MYANISEKNIMPIFRVDPEAVYSSKTQIPTVSLLRKPHIFFSALLARKLNIKCRSILGISSGKNRY
jgi:hypothetical protein